VTHSTAGACLETSVAIRGPGRYVSPGALRSPQEPLRGAGMLENVSRSQPKRLKPNVVRTVPTTVHAVGRTSWRAYLGYGFELGRSSARSRCTPRHDARSHGPRSTPEAAETNRGLSTYGLVGQGSTHGQQTPRHWEVIRASFTWAKCLFLLGLLDRDVLSGSRRADLLIPWS